MPFAITSDHREFYNKNGFIELEGLLAANQVHSLRDQAAAIVCKRLGIPLSKMHTKTSSELFLAGYDLWRDNAEIKKILHKKSLAHIASELFQILPLRCGFDQYVATTTGTFAPFTETIPLQQACCIAPLAGALILTLQDLREPLPFFPLPIRAGNVLFISPSLPIPWKELFLTPSLHFIVVGFAMDKARFCADTPDPHAVRLKKQGYVFNDQLKETLHPTLFS